MLEERMIVLCLRVFVEFKWIRALQSSARRTLPWPQFSKTLGSIRQAIWGLLPDTANLARASLRFSVARFSGALWA
ncbi:hypothetical protein [Parasphingorhabdus sp. NYA22]